MSDAHFTIESAAVATPDLVDAVARLLPQLSQSTPPNTDALQRIIDHDAVTLLIARATDSSVIGMLTLVTFPLPTGVRGWIEDVVVDEATRGMGVATQLLDEATRRAIELGARSLDLTSRPSREDANRLYQRLGFAARETNVYRHDLKSPKSR